MITKFIINNIHDHKIHNLHAHNLQKNHGPHDPTGISQEEFNVVPELVYALVQRQLF